MILGMGNMWSARFQSSSLLSSQFAYVGIEPHGHIKKSLCVGMSSEKRKKVLARRSVGCQPIGCDLSIWHFKRKP